MEKNEGNSEENQTPVSLLNEAKRQLASGETASAIATLKKALELDSKRADIWYELAKAYHREGLRDEMEECCEHVLELKPAWSKHIERLRDLPLGSVRERRAIEEVQERFDELKPDRKPVKIHADVLESHRLRHDIGQVGTRSVSFTLPPGDDLEEANQLFMSREFDSAQLLLVSYLEKHAFNTTGWNMLKEVLCGKRLIESYIAAWRATSLATEKLEIPDSIYTSIRKMTIAEQDIPKLLSEIRNISIEDAHRLHNALYMFFTTSKIRLRSESWLVFLAIVDLVGTRMARSYAKKVLKIIKAGDFIPIGVLIFAFETK